MSRLKARRIVDSSCSACPINSGVIEFTIGGMTIRLCRTHRIELVTLIMEMV